MTPIAQDHGAAGVRSDEFFSAFFHLTYEAAFVHLSIILVSKSAKFKNCFQAQLFGLAGMAFGQNK